MRYSKPEVAVLGDAARIVETLGKPNGAVIDEPFDDDHPAYDLDE